MRNLAPFGGSTPLIVDKLLGVSFTVVKEVQENLDVIRDAATLLAGLEALYADIKGIPGDKGDKGDIGVGEKGDKGDIGIGLKGDKGDRGLAGETPDLDAVNAAIAALNVLVSDETTNRLASVATVNTARIAGDLTLATSVTAVVASVGSVNSRVTTEQIARTSSFSALASSLNVVTTTLNGMTSTITTLSQSVNGVKAMYGVTLDVNGFITGFRQNNDGLTGSFDILATSFRVSMPGNVPVPVFGVDIDGVFITGNVRVHGNLLVTGSVQTDAMPQNAISNSAFYRSSYAGQMQNFTQNAWRDFSTVTSGGTPGSGGGSDGGGSTPTTVSVILPCFAGGRSVITWNMSSVRSGGDNDRSEWRVVRRKAGHADFYLIGTPQITMTSREDTRSWTWIDDNTPADGSWQYVLQVRRVAGSGTVLEIVLLGQHFKR